MSYLSLHKHKPTGPTGSPHSLHGSIQLGLGGAGLTVRSRRTATSKAEGSVPPADAPSPTSTSDAPSPAFPTVALAEHDTDDDKEEGAEEVSEGAMLSAARTKPRLPPATRLARPRSRGPARRACARRGGRIPEVFRRYDRRCDCGSVGVQVVVRSLQCVRPCGGLC